MELLAKLDTGAAHCIFERKYGEMLGLAVESGRPQRFRTVAGSFAAYEHEVTIQTLGIEFQAIVFFAQDSTFNRNFLGRSGWLDRLRIGIMITTGCSSWLRINLRDLRLLKAAEPCERREGLGWVSYAT